MLHKLKSAAALVESAVALVAFSILVIVVAANVLLRFATGNSLVFTEEVAYISFGYLIFLGASFLFRLKSLIAIDIVVDSLPPVVRRTANILTYTTLVATTSYFAFVALDLATSSWLRTTAFLRIPYFWVYLAPAISFSLMSISSLTFLYSEIRFGSVVVETPQEQL